ncbi:MAG: exodeoxyribonuclease VII large subunit [Desulfobacterium sp.]|nr:exodeoxyribonuclease VII large subunit [Desulfobacterium sp.]
MVQVNDFRQIFTVSKLTGAIKALVEESFPLVWITGEVSNFSLPASGHAYFSLKDANSVISGVMFRNQRKRLRFAPENGMKIVGMGRLSLYEPRGTYQIIFEHMEPSGTGALQAAFEQLKQKLALEGLFDQDRKRKIPYLPEKISIVTSPTGAVIRDIINVSTRRFPNIALEIVPVKVQGVGADAEIAEAVALVNRMAESDLIIVARGGGSLEDLVAFNSEVVARAIFNSTIPVISAVGHETDFTIADFVADVRAPTPSAAAELALPEKSALFSRIMEQRTTILRAITLKQASIRERILDLTARLKDPKRSVDDLRFKLEDLESRMARLIHKRTAACRERLDWFVHALFANSPARLVLSERETVNARKHHLEKSMTTTLGRYRGCINELTARLEALGPMGVLDRGYSITRTHPGKSIVMNSAEIEIDNTVEIILAQGTLFCEVKEKNDQKKDI